MRIPMGRCGLAIKTLFKVLFSADFASRVRAIETGDAEMTQVIESKPVTEKPAPPPSPAPPPPPPKPSRSEALTLLEAFQREGRLVDFLKENITGYQDAQVGAAVREVHRGCAEVLNRFFDIGAVVDAEEGGKFEVTSSSDAAEVRLIGNVVETRPVTGTLVHSGWKAKKCDLPKWTGASKHECIIAPAEVELG